VITKLAFVAQPTKNMENMRRFYGDLLGLEMKIDYDVWTEYETPCGKTVALDTFSGQVADVTPYMALETDDIEAEVAKLKEAGATVAKDIWSNEHEGQLLCKMAIVNDPDGNPLMLHQMADWRRDG